MIQGRYTPMIGQKQATLDLVLEPTLQTVGPFSGPTCSVHPSPLTMATTTTVTIISSPSSPFMLPGMSSAESSRVVRFSDECVLIPESPRSKRRMLTKSYSLPLWKRKPSQFSDSEADESPSFLNNVEETRVVLKVPLPT